MVWFQGYISRYRSRLLTEKQAFAEEEGDQYYEGGQDEKKGE